MLDHGQGAIFPTNYSQVKPSNMAGFTLIELMVIIAILGILFSAATPSVRTMFINHEADGLLSELELDIQFARNQAITRTNLIMIRPINGNWNTGWQVIDGIEVLRQRGSTDLPIADLGGLTSDDYSTSNPLTFDRQGRVDTAGEFRIQVPGCTGERNITLSIQFLGQIVVSRADCT